MKQAIALFLCAIMLIGALPVCAAEEWNTATIDFTDSLKTFDRNPGRGRANTLDTQFWITAEKEGTTYMPTADDFNEQGVYTPLYQLGAFSSGNSFTAEGADSDIKNEPGRVGGVNIDIDSDTLASIEACCQLAKEQGAKLVFLFAYDKDGYVGSEPDDISWIVRHIEQLGAVLSRYAGTVISVECGLIGPWGEMHSSMYDKRKLANQIIDAWLTNLDESIPVTCRRMSFILDYCGMLPQKFMKNLPISSESPAYRLGMYNSGYLGDEGDYGTFDRPSSSQSQKLYRENAITFLKDAAKRCPYGGELAYSTLEHLRSDRSPIYTDGIVKELYDTHLTYLRNIGKSSPVINGELASIKLGQNHAFEGMPDISAYYGQSLQKFMLDHMGYRFVLRNAMTSAAVKAGDMVQLKGSIENVGFGNIFGQYYPELILTDSEGTVIAVTDAYIDPAKWESASTAKYSITLTVPDNLSGEYSVYLRISSIRYEDHEAGTCYVSFANPDIVNDALGANYLGSFTVSGKGGNATAFEQVNNGSFTDVNPGSWYEDAVYYAAYYGVVNGVGAGKFAPESTTTRAMAVQVLYNIEGKPDVSTAESPFTDIGGKWYESAVKWAYANKIVTGITPTVFNPEGKLTREQFAAILFRYNSVKGYDSAASAEITGFSDYGEVSKYAREALAWANGMEYITGVSETVLRPKGNATRAQMAQIMTRFLKNNR